MFLRPPTPLSQGLDDRAPLSEGLDPPLLSFGMFIKKYLEVRSSHYKV